MTLAAFVVPSSDLQTLQRVIENVSGPLAVNLTATNACLLHYPQVQLGFAKTLLSEREL